MSAEASRLSRLEAESRLSRLEAESRLSRLEAAWVIARRDFVAVLFSRAFLFFLLGPLFPVLIGGLAGAVGSSVSKEAAVEEVGIAMSAADNAAMIAAAGYFRAQDENYVDPLGLAADPNLDIV